MIIIKRLTNVWNVYGLRLVLESPSKGVFNCSTKFLIISLHFLDLFRFIKVFCSHFDFLNGMNVSTYIKVKFLEENMLNYIELTKETFSKDERNNPTNNL